MSTCRYCGKILILNRGKCFFCDRKPQNHVFEDKLSPYTDYIGQNDINGVPKDDFGNPLGTQYDLSRDGALKGYKIVVLCLYSYSDVPGGKIMANALTSLIRKGFEVVEINPNITNVSLLKKELDSDNCQLWVISNDRCVLTTDYCDLIYNHFYAGRGLYIWSDNAPFFADSNILLRKLFNTEMSGNYYGSKILSYQQEIGTSGIIKGHPISTGIVNFFEGITISNIKLTQELRPLVYSSDGKIVTAFYDLNGRRCLIDGGFTRLYYNWGSAGTDRFVVNCATWLANIENLGYKPK